MVATRNRRSMFARVEVGRSWGAASGWSSIWPAGNGRPRCTSRRTPPTEQRRSGRPPQAPPSPYVAEHVLPHLPRFAHVERERDLAVLKRSRSRTAVRVDGDL